MISFYRFVLYFFSLLIGWRKEKLRIRRTFNIFYFLSICLSSMFGIYVFFFYTRQTSKHLLSPLLRSFSYIEKGRNNRKKREKPFPQAVTLRESKKESEQVDSSNSHIRSICLSYCFLFMPSFPLWHCVRSIHPFYFFILLLLSSCLFFFLHSSL